MQDVWVQLPLGALELLRCGPMVRRLAVNQTIAGSIPATAARNGRAAHGREHLSRKQSAQALRVRLPLLPLGDRLTVGRQSLKLLMKVRTLLPELFFRGSRCW